MLSFIGLGISGISELSDNTLSVIKNAKVVYLESFTSPIPDTEKKQLENICNGEFKIAKRWLVEDGNEILDNAKKKKTVLISYGDPYIATTHLELKTRAIKDGIETKTIHSSSIVSSVIGKFSFFTSPNSSGVHDTNILGLMFVDLTLSNKLIVP